MSSYFAIITGCVFIHFIVLIIKTYDRILNKLYPKTVVQVHEFAIIPLSSTVTNISFFNFFNFFFFSFKYGNLCNLNCHIVKVYYHIGSTFRQWGFHIHMCEIKRMENFKWSCLTPT